MTTLGDAAELDAAIGAVDWAALPPGDQLGASQLLPG